MSEDIDLSKKSVKELVLEILLRVDSLEQQSQQVKKLEDKYIEVKLKLVEVETKNKIYSRINGIGYGAVTSLIVSIVSFFIRTK
jgi:tetrahydromethanopterin S-methyltransferase subunit G